MVSKKTAVVGAEVTPVYRVLTYLYSETDDPIEQLFTTADESMDVRKYVTSIIHDGVERVASKGVVEVIPPHSIKRVTFEVVPDATDA